MTFCTLWGFFWCLFAIPGESAAGAKGVGGTNAAHLGGTACCARGGTWHKETSPGLKAAKGEAEFSAGTLGRGSPGARQSGRKGSAGGAEQRSPNSDKGTGRGAGSSACSADATSLTDTQISRKKPSSRWFCLS